MSAEIQLFLCAGNLRACVCVCVCVCVSVWGSIVPGVYDPMLGKMVSEDGGEHTKVFISRGRTTFAH